jgi:hypothetical protein
VSWYRFGQMEAKPQEKLPGEQETTQPDGDANDDGRIVAIRSGDKPH